MNSRFLKIAMIAGASFFCVSSSGQTWTRVGSATPFTDYPTGTSGTATQYRIAIGSTAAASSQLYVKSQATSLTPLIVNTQASPTVDIARFQVNGTSKVVINNAGSVGIGVTAPTVKLDVAGDIKCTSVKINTWTIAAPDYVFAPDYKLRSLAEVEKHINTEKHLPEVPSAAEMKKSGVDLSEMNMTLLKKVEELTLYAIDQNKKIEAQQKDIQELKTALLGKK